MLLYLYVPTALGKRLAGMVSIISPSTAFLCLMFTIPIIFPPFYQNGTQIPAIRVSSQIIK